LQQGALQEAVVIVESEQSGGHLPDGSNPDDLRALQSEMVSPAVNARIERRVKVPSTGETEPTSVPFARLQRAHERARFDTSVMPPCLRLIT